MTSLNIFLAEKLTWPGFIFARNKNKYLNSGFTLIEMLIVVVISIFVLAIAFTVYRLNVDSYLNEDASLQQDQNLRVALFTIARDVRMAGNGFSLLGPRVRTIQLYVPSSEIKNEEKWERIVENGWFWHADANKNNLDERGARAIYGVDGGINGPDTISIFNAEVESGAPIGTIKSAYQPGVNAGLIRLKAPFPANSVRNNDLLALVQGSVVSILEINSGGDKVGDFLAPSTDISVKLNGGRFMPPQAELLPFPEGSSVYNLRDISFVTYYLDTKNNYLMADYHDIAMNSPDNESPGTVVVATNIEDLQAYYFFDQDIVSIDRVTQSPDISSAVLNNRKVKAVAIALTAKSPYSDGKGKRFFRPALFNRQKGDNADDHQRKTLNEIVYLRNF